MTVSPAKAAQIEAAALRFKAAWADPEKRQKMLDASARGVQRAAENRRKRFPVPADRKDRNKFDLIRRSLGAQEARRVFGLDQGNDA